MAVSEGSARVASNCCLQAWYASRYDSEWFALNRFIMQWAISRGVNEAPFISPASAGTAIIGAAMNRETTGIM